MVATPYLAMYALAGAIFALGILLNQRLPLFRGALATLLLVLFWPIFVLFLPEVFFRPDKPYSDQHESQELSSALTHILENESDSLGSNLASKLRQTSNLSRPVKYFGAGCDFSDVLDAFWDENIPPNIFLELSSARAELLDHGRESHSRILFSLAEPEWFVGFSSEFLKCISSVDGKMRGRILDAIGKLSYDPLQPVGNTIKPLTANLSGLWRYRIGDERLVYFPNKSTRRITLLYFGSRSDVYDHSPSRWSN